MNTAKFLIVPLLIGCSFLLGVAVNYTPKPDLVKMATYTVQDYLSYPESASFRNVKYNFVRETADKGDLGYVCGEVFRIKNEKLEGYKKFVVKTYNNRDGRVSLSIPLIEDNDDIQPVTVIEPLWRKYCK